MECMRLGGDIEGEEYPSLTYRLLELLTSSAGTGCHYHHHHIGTLELIDSSGPVSSQKQDDQHHEQDGKGRD